MNINMQHIFTEKQGGGYSDKERERERDTNLQMLNNTNVKEETNVLDKYVMVSHHKQPQNLFLGHKCAVMSYLRYLGRENALVPLVAGLDAAARNR